MECQTPLGEGKLPFWHFLTRSMYNSEIFLAKHGELLYLTCHFKRRFFSNCCMTSTDCSCDKTYCILFLSGKTG